MTTGNDEVGSPEAIFERINRRRAARTGQATRSPEREARSPERETRSPEQARHFAGRHASPTGTKPSGSYPPGSQPPGSAPPRDTPAEAGFPRSTTMRTLLSHPALALGIGVPAAALLLRKPAARRLLQAGLVLAARPEVRAIVAAGFAAAQRAVEERRARGSDPSAGTAMTTPEQPPPDTGDGRATSASDNA